jgi:hypothetical protein
MPFIEDDHVVQKISPHRPDQPLQIWILPGRSWGRIPRKGRDELPGSHVEMHDPAGRILYHQEHVAHLAGDRWHGEEVPGDNLVGVVLQEGLPVLSLPVLHDRAFPTAAENLELMA